MTIEDLARMMAAEFSNMYRVIESGKSELRAEFRQGFEKVNHRLDVHIAQTAQGFEDVDKRFDSLEAGTHRRLTIVETTLKTLVKK
ncbi:MAG: hypothetical protein RL292_600 [Candidatus Parcubacteria bacterium]